MIDNSQIYLVSSGCSYTLPCNFKKRIKSNLEGGDINPHWIGTTSAGMGYIKDSTISHISYLLKNNIPSEHIITFIDITQIGRMSIKIPNYIWDGMKDSFNILTKTSYIGHEFIFYENGVVSFDGQVYSSMNFGENDFKKYSKISKKWILNQIESHENLDFTIHIKNYIEDILLLQTFLKLNNIEYYFYFMNNTFEGWYHDTDGILRHRYSSHNEYKLPNLKLDLNISDIHSSIKSIYNLLDFKKFLLYTNDKQNFGGLDEYCTDNYSKDRFKDFHINDNSECMIGFHPDDGVCNDFENEYLYPKWVKFYNNLKNIKNEEI